MDSDNELEVTQSYADSPQGRLDTVDGGSTVIGVDNGDTINHAAGLVKRQRMSIDETPYSVSCWFHT